MAGSTSLSGLRSTAVTSLAFAVGLIALGRLWGATRPRASFEGRVVLLTGGSRGLGLELARGLVAEGAAVVIVARDGEELEVARAELVRSGGAVLAIAADITVKEQVDLLVDKVQAVFGGIDVLINNAGMIVVGPESQTTLDDYRASMDLHFWAPLHLIQACLPGMRKRGNGQIVNISSVGGLAAIPHMTAYSATKHALVGLSDGLRAELAADGIAVTTVCPGLLCTGSARHAIVKGDAEKEYEWFAQASFSPLMATSSDRAAKLILDAVRDRRPRLVIGLQARALDVLSTVSPGLFAAATKRANAVLPDPVPGGEVPRVAGEVDPFRDVRSARGFEAAMANNELHPTRTGVP